MQGSEWQLCMLLVRDVQQYDVLSHVLCRTIIRQIIRQIYAGLEGICGGLPGGMKRISTKCPHNACECMRQKGRRLRKAHGIIGTREHGCVTLLLSPEALLTGNRRQSRA